MHTLDRSVAEREIEGAFNVLFGHKNCQQLRDPLPVLGTAESNGTRSEKVDDINLDADP